MNPAAWSESLGDDLQPTFDYALTEGLNRLFWHEFTSSPQQYGLPGQEYFAGTHLNPQVTWWGQAGPFLTALNRAQFLMQQGKPVGDLLYFYGDQVPGFVRLRNDDPAHVLPGYDYDVTDEGALLHRMIPDGSGLRTPEGIHYRALTLPVSRNLSYASLKWVSIFVQQGGIVIGLKPIGSLGLIAPEEQAEFDRTASAMWAGCEGGATVSHFGRGTIYCTGDSRSALLAMGVTPDFEYQLYPSEVAAQKDARAFEFIHRTLPDAEIYFVRNTQPRPLQATLSFRIHGTEPELWSTDDGTTTPALVYRETSDGRTEISLTFPARGSVFIVFEKPSPRHLVKLERDGSAVFPSIRDGAGVFSSADHEFTIADPGTYIATDSDGAKQNFVVETTDLQTPESLSWTLSFPSGWGAPQSVPWEHFQSWTESTDPGIRYFSGTATYRTVLHMSDDFAVSSRQLWLQLGQVREIATVKVNGQPVETLWRQPFAARIDRALHPGDNIIEIKVSNLWPNRLIGDLQPNATEKYTHTNIRAYTKDSPLLPSGILQLPTLQNEIVLRWR